MRTPGTAPATGPTSASQPLGETGTAPATVATPAPQPLGPPNTAQSAGTTAAARRCAETSGRTQHRALHARHDAQLRERAHDGWRPAAARRNWLGLALHPPGKAWSGPDARQTPGPAAAAESAPVALPGRTPGSAQVSVAGHGGPPAPAQRPVSNRGPGHQADSARAVQHSGSPAPGAGPDPAVPGTSQVGLAAGQPGAEKRPSPWARRGRYPGPAADGRLADGASCASDTDRSADASGPSAGERTPDRPDPARRHGPSGQRLSGQPARSASASGDPASGWPSGRKHWPRASWTNTRDRCSWCCDDPGLPSGLPWRRPAGHLRRQHGQSRARQQGHPQARQERDLRARRHSHRQAGGGAIHGAAAGRPRRGAGLGDMAIPGLQPTATTPGRSAHGADAVSPGGPGSLGSGQFSDTAGPRGTPPARGMARAPAALRRGAVPLTGLGRRPRKRPPADPRPPPRHGRQRPTVPGHGRRPCGLAPASGPASTPGSPAPAGPGLAARPPARLVRRPAGCSGRWSARRDRLARAWFAARRARPQYTGGCASLR